MNKIIFVSLWIFAVISLSATEKTYYSNDFESDNDMYFRLCCDPPVYHLSQAIRRGYLKVHRATITNQSEGKAHSGVRSFALDITVDKNTGKWGARNCWSSRKKLNISINSPVYLTAFIYPEEVHPDLSIRMSVLFNGTKNGKKIKSGFFSFAHSGLNTQGWMIFQKDLSKYIKSRGVKQATIIGWQLTIISPSHLPFRGQRVKIFLDDVKISSEKTKIAVDKAGKIKHVDIVGGAHRVGYTSLYKNFPVTSVNRIKNSSFELGLDAWYTGVFLTPNNLRPGNLKLPAPSRAFEVIADDSIHGHKVLQISRPSGIPNHCRLSSLPIPIKDGQAYTISFYAKSNRPTNIKLIQKVRKSFRINTEWKRYSLYIPSIQCETRGNGKKFNGRYILRITHSGNETVLLDAIQLQEGKLSDYRTPNIVSIATRPANYDGLYLPNENLEFKISLFNGSKLKRTVKINYQIDDFQHRKIIEKTQVLNLEPQSGIELKKALPTGYRHYKITAKLDVEGLATQKAITAVSVIDDLSKIKGNDFFGTLGCHSNNPANFKDGLELNRKAGMGWMMWYNVSNLNRDPNWRTDNKQWNRIEFVLDNIRTYGFTPFIEIGPVFPVFTKKNSKGIEIVTKREENEVYEWCKKLAEKLKDKARYYGVFGEYMKGKLGARAANIRKLLPCAYKALKKGNPNCVVVACGEDAARNRQMLIQLEAHFKLGTLSYMDAVSLHPYTCTEGPEKWELQKQFNELRGIMKKYNKGNVKPIWCTEAGYRTVDTLHYDDVEPETTYYPRHVTELEQAERVVRDNIIAMGEGVSRYESFYLDPGPRFFSFSFIQRENGIRPKTIFPAFNFMVKELSGTTPIKRFEQPQNSLMGYFFRNKKELIAVVWRYNSDNIYKKAIVNIPSEKLKVFNLVGEKIKPAPGKKLELQLGGSAFYIHSNGIPDIEFIKMVKNIKIDNLAMTFRLLNSNKVETVLNNGKVGIARGTLQVNSASPVKFVLQPGEREKILSSFSDIDILTAKVNSNKGNFFSEIKLLNMSKAGKYIEIDANLNDFSVVNPIKLENRFSRYSELKYGGERDLSANIFTLYDKDNFYLGVTVRDDIYAGPYTMKTKPSMIWANDAIQVAFKCKKDINMTEINFSLTQDGPGVFATMGKPDLDKIKYAIKRTKDITTYEIAIPWQAIWPGFSLENNVDTQFNIAVIDNDGNPKISTANRFIGDKQALQLTLGIVDSKAPEKFRFLLF